MKIINPTNISDEIYEYSKKILKEMWNDDVIRLIGIRLDNLVDKTSKQISLFDTDKEIKKDDTLDKTIDKLREKYGNDIIKKPGSVNINYKD